MLPSEVSVLPSAWIPPFAASVRLFAPCRRVSTLSSSLLLSLLLSVTPYPYTGAENTDRLVLKGVLPGERARMWNGGAYRAAVASVPAMPFVVAQWHSGPQDSGALPGGLLQ